MFLRGINERVCRFGDAFEFWFALQIEENRCFFDAAAFEYAPDDFVAVQRFAGVFEYICDDF